MDALSEYLDRFVKRGYTNQIILCHLERDLDLSISERTLKRWLNKFGIRRHDNTVTPVHVMNAISVERQGPRKYCGVRYLHFALRNKHNLRITRDQVADVAFLMDPENAIRQRSTMWARRLTYCPGPNYRWCLDGYDKLSEFGIFIHGCTDEYSRRLMWLEAFDTNRIPEIILRYYLKALSEVGVAPFMTVSDLGWEALHIAESQLLLYFNNNPSVHHQWTYSVRNVTIESFWRQLRHRAAQYWIEKFTLFKQQGLYNGGQTDKYCLLFVYMPFIKEDLMSVMDYHHGHRIRSQPRCIRPSGQPENLYSFPELYGHSNQGLPVSESKVKEIMRLHNQTTLNLPDYVPSDFRSLAEQWWTVNNIDCILDVNDEQTYLSLRQHILSL